MNAEQIADGLIKVGVAKRERRHLLLAELEVISMTILGADIAAAITLIQNQQASIASLNAQITALKAAQPPLVGDQDDANELSQLQSLLTSSGVTVTVPTNAPTPATAPST